MTTPHHSTLPQAREQGSPHRGRRFVEPFRAPTDLRAFFAIIVIVLLAMAGPRPARALDIDVSGYVKNFFVVQDPPEVAIDETREVALNTMLADNLRTRLETEAEFTDWMKVNAAYNLVPRLQDDDAAAFGAALGRQTASVYRIDDLRASLWPVTPDADDNFVVLQNLDRLFVSFSAPAFDFYLGRQAVAWGSAKSVNPTDVIAPFLYTEIDTENRIGVDAARLRVPVGALSEIDAGYVAGRNAEWEESAAYLRAKGYFWNTDITGLAMRFRGDNLLVGADMTRALWEAGFWIEAAAVAHDRTGAPGLDDLDYARVSTGIDYTLENATYLFLEYHYNGAGSGDPAGYAQSARDPAYTDGAVYLLGRHYLAPGVSWPVTLIFNVGGTALVNLDDGSVLLAPTVEYNILENVYLSAGAFAGLGDSPSLATTETAPGTLIPDAALDFESEFGAYSDTYFISARYYF